MLVEVALLLQTFCNLATGWEAQKGRYVSGVGQEGERKGCDRRGG